MSARGPIRVLHLRDSPWVDGPGRTILETAARIDRARIDYHVAPLVPDDGAGHPLVVALRERGAPVHPILDTGESLALLVERVTALVDRLGIEILHSSEVRSNVVALRCRKRRPALRLISTAHGWIANDWKGKLKTLVDRWLLRRFDRVILVSHAMRRRLPRWWVPDSHVVVIHNALALDSYGGKHVSVERNPPVAGAPIELLATGRLSPEKGIALLLRAIALLLPSHPGIRLTIAGAGPEEGGLKALADRLSITKNVRFIGYISDMPVLYTAADLVVQSSLTEGLPNVMLEAAYLGVPVVATDVGGTREVIEHGVSGWLIDAGSVSALVTGIRRYLDRPEEFVAMAMAGRRRIEQGFSFDVRTTRQSALYCEVAGTTE